MQLVDGFLGICLHAVVDDDMTCINAVDGNVDDGAHQFAGMFFDAEGLHHLVVAHTNYASIDFGLDAMTSHFFHFRQAATIVVGFGIGIAQSLGDGVSGVMFDVCGKVQQVLLVVFVGMYGGDSEYSFCERTCLIEHHSLDLRKLVDIVGAFDQNTIA